jgi:LacI family transcriptional regulator
MATIQDIARELNITASTVSRALQDHPRISDGTKKAVLKTAKRLNYQPNHIAAALRNGKSKIIGIIVPTTDRNFFATIIRGIEEVANKSKYNVMICQSHDDYDKEVSTVEALLNARVDGIIASYGKGTGNFDHFMKVKKKGIPLVLFDRAHYPLDVSHVVIDDYLASFNAVEHLIQQGCKRIAHFTATTRKISIFKERIRGYKEALEHNGIAFDPELIIEGNLELEDGREGMQKLLALSDPPDAVFSASAYSAIGAIQVLKEKGIRIPEQVAIVGFSNEPFTSFSDPPLTTIDQQSMRIGKTTAEIFLEQIASNGTYEPKRVVLTPELIIRQSSLKKK